MKIVIAAVVAVFGLSASLFAGESHHTKEFTVRAKPDVVAKWLKDNPKEVARSTGSEIVSQDGEKVRLRQDTPRGLMEFTVRETVEENGQKVNYNSALVEVHEGLIEDQTTKVTIEPDGNGTAITIELFAKVKNVKPVAVRTGLSKSARGFQELVERKFNGYKR